MSTPSKHVEAEMLRRLAVAAEVDPRTLRKLLRGAEVKGMAGRRARQVLADAGLLAVVPVKGTVR